MVRQKKKVTSKARKSASSGRRPGQWQGPPWQAANGKKNPLTAVHILMRRRKGQGGGGLGGGGSGRTLFERYPPEEYLEHTAQSGNITRYLIVTAIVAVVGFAAFGGLFLYTEWAALRFRENEELQGTQSHHRYCAYLRALDLAGRNGRVYASTANCPQDLNANQTLEEEPTDE